MIRCSALVSAGRIGPLDSRHLRGTRHDGLHPVVGTRSGRGGALEESARHAPRGRGRLWVSPATLSRAIDAARGGSFRAWQRRIVLARTEGQLLQPDRPLSVKEVAVALGFTSSSTLARWFRTQTGLTPSAYRTRHDARRISATDLPRETSGTPLAGGGSVEPLGSGHAARHATGPGDADV